MRRRPAIASLAALALVAMACATPPDVDRPTAPPRVWLSVGGELSDFSDDEADCVDRATSELAGRVDEHMFAVCMFDRGWRENQGVDPRVASVSPLHSVRSRVNVRARPTTGSDVLSALATGDRAQLLGQEGDWYHVRLPDGKEGYVSARWTRTLQ